MAYNARLLAGQRIVFGGGALVPGHLVMVSDLASQDAALALPACMAHERLGDTAVEQARIAGCLPAAPTNDQADRVLMDTPHEVEQQIKRCPIGPMHIIEEDHPPMLLPIAAMPCARSHQAARECLAIHLDSAALIQPDGFPVDLQPFPRQRFIQFGERAAQSSTRVALIAFRPEQRRQRIPALALSHHREIGHQRDSLAPIDNNRLTVAF
ncbi:MAG: hypothetical protein H0W02_07340 [Ktedonobacteraceae bacterium]|nr:hypothetical protein [Ktedonobacteraceae bacterium]